MRLTFVINLLAFGLAALSTSSARGMEPRQIGVVRVDVTPKFPIRMTGYGNRAKESSGVASPLKAAPWRRAGRRTNR